MDTACVSNEFLRTYVSDLSRGGIQHRLAYQELFPDHREMIGELFDQMVDAEASEDARLEAALGGSLEVGPYLVLRQLGRGGQGVVYLAQDARLGRTVAIKMLTHWGASSDEALQRFRREAEIASGIDHPSICKIYDTGVDRGTPYIVLQYVEGVSLAQRLHESERLQSGVVRLEGCEDEADFDVNDDIGVVVQFFAEMAQALDTAHERGVIHRDVKPSNVLVTPDCGPMLMDFGIARSEEETSALTRSGDLFGTPTYMSPEMLDPSSGSVDRRTDVWSLGVCLYECLTLQVPFHGRDFKAVLRQVAIRDPRPPRKLNPRIPRDLEAIVLKALEKDTGRRYGTAAELAEDLNRFLQLQPIRARSITAAGRLIRFARREPAKAVAIVLGALLVVGGPLVFGVQQSLARQQADSLRKTGDERLADFRRMADVRRLVDYLREAEELWPAHPDKLDAMQTWLDKAHSLVSRLPIHRTKLDEIQARLSDDAETRWEEGVLSELVQGVEVLADPDPHVGAIANVEERMAFARTVRERTIVGRQAEWDRAVASISDEEECPQYEGRTISPQLGLIPLGRDPGSGLWEFYHPQSGASPERDDEGQLVIAPHSGLVLVLLPGGTFNMGSRPADAQHPLGSPNVVVYDVPDSVHPVTLDPFFISKYEMSQGQWERIAGSNPMPADQRGSSNPVGNVSWTDCKRVLKRLDLSMPTEAQWEYAARAGTTTTWWTGSDVESTRGAANTVSTEAAGHLEKDEWRLERNGSISDGYAGLAPVTALLPNPFGLYGIIGNVWEWCNDAHGPYDLPVSPGDGARMVPNGTQYNFRGGCFQYGISVSRSSFRGSNLPDDRDYDLGVRPARPLDP